jgi:hypothetical protein
MLDACVNTCSGVADKASRISKCARAVGKKNNDSKRRLIKKAGVDLWNEFHAQVIKRVEREEADEKWR